MVNGPHDIWIERGGLLSQTALAFTDESHLRRIITKMVGQVGRRIDESSPMVDARLPDGSRVNAIIPPLSLSGPLLTIRKFAQNRFAMAELVEIGTLSRDSADFLANCVQAELNILVSGGTGSGKTTLLNAMSAAIPDSDRIVTIEDAAELQLDQRHVLRLESRPKNIEGEGEITIRDLVRNALRMRPDRIIVGEVRGAEALDMLQAMNTGHEGSLSTVHANSPRDALNRLETMVLMAGYELPLRAIRQHVSSALDLIIQLDRLDDGTRHVVAIAEVQRMEGETITLQKLFEFNIDRVDADRRWSAGSSRRASAPGSCRSSSGTGSSCREPVRRAATAMFGADAKRGCATGRTDEAPLAALAALVAARARRRRGCGDGADDGSEHSSSRRSPGSRSRSAATSSASPRRVRSTRADVGAGERPPGHRRRRRAGRRSGIHFGVVLALDASESMTGAPLAGALDAARALRHAARGRAGGRHRRLQRRHQGRSAPTHDAARPAPRARRRRRSSPTARASTTRSTRSLALLRGAARERLDRAPLRRRRHRQRQHRSTRRSPPRRRSMCASSPSGSARARSTRRRCGRSRGRPAGRSPRLVARAAGRDLRRARPQLASEYVVRYRSDARPSRRSTSRSVRGLGAATTTYVAPTPALLRALPPLAGLEFVLSGGSPFVLALLFAAARVRAASAVARRPKTTVVERVETFARVARVRPRTRRGRDARGAPEPLRHAAVGAARARLEIARMTCDAAAGRRPGARRHVRHLPRRAGALGAAVRPLRPLTPLIARGVDPQKLKGVRDLFADQLPGNLQVLASALRTGHSFIGALSVVVDNAHEPAKRAPPGDAGRAARRAPRRGDPEARRRMASRDLEQVALLAELQRTAGGNSAEVLDTVVETIRERADLRRLVRTLTAQGRMARWILRRSRSA